MKPENPQAFTLPVVLDSNDDVRMYGQEGMTLRDYFAAAALHSAASYDTAHGMARRVYYIADAMLAAREAR